MRNTAKVFNTLTHTLRFHKI